jgi:hypothetical protein
MCGLYRSIGDRRMVHVARASRALRWAGLMERGQELAVKRRKALAKRRETLKSFGGLSNYLDALYMDQEKTPTREACRGSDPLSELPGKELHGRT